MGTLPFQTFALFYQRICIKWKHQNRGQTEETDEPFKELLETWRARPVTHYKKILLGVAIFFAVFTIVGFFVLHPS